jgi:DNA-binding NarL/FixJ family response regulator
VRITGSFGGEIKVENKLNRMGLPFTLREMEVLQYVVKGLMDKEIAEALEISLATVKFHVHNLLQKAGVKDRVHLVILAYERNLFRKT